MTQLLEHKAPSLLDEARIAAGSALDVAPDALKVSLLAQRKPSPDDVTKLILRPECGDGRLWVMYVSSSAAPRMVGLCMSRMRSIRQALGPRLGEVMLHPVAEGEILGRSFAIVPYCRPFGKTRGARRISSLIVGPLVLRWLHEAVAATRTSPSDSQVEQCVIKPLIHLSELNVIKRRWRAAARDAIDRVQAGQWKPVRVMEHGDLWMGNVLQPQADSRFNLIRRLPRPFTLLDWHGGRLDSPGMYDLMRMARSMRLSPSALRRHIRRHCSRERLDCAESAAMGCLAASLGHISLHLGHFPMEKFAAMAEGCFESLAGAIEPA